MTYNLNLQCKSLTNFITLKNSLILKPFMCLKSQVYTIYILYT